MKYQYGNMIPKSQIAIRIKLDNYQREISLIVGFEQMEEIFQKAQSLSKRTTCDIFFWLESFKQQLLRGEKWES